MLMDEGRQQLGMSWNKVVSWHSISYVTWIRIATVIHNTQSSRNFGADIHDISTPTPVLCWRHFLNACCRVRSFLDLLVASTHPYSTIGLLWFGDYASNSRFIEVSKNLSIQHIGLWSKCKVFDSTVHTVLVHGVWWVFFKVKIFQGLH